MKADVFFEAVRFLFSSSSSILFLRFSFLVFLMLINLCVRQLKWQAPISMPSCTQMNIVSMHRLQSRCQRTSHDTLRLNGVRRRATQTTFSV